MHKTRSILLYALFVSSAFCAAIVSAAEQGSLSDINALSPTKQAFPQDFVHGLVNLEFSNYIPENAWPALTQAAALKGMRDSAESIVPRPPGVVRRACLLLPPRQLRGRTRDSQRRGVGRVLRAGRPDSARRTCSNGCTRRPTSQAEGPAPVTGR